METPNNSIQPRSDHMHHRNFRRNRPRPQRRPAILVALLTAFAGIAGAAHAAEYNEKLKAPRMKTTAELRTQVQALRQRIEAASQSPSTERLTDTAMAREQFDLSWQVQHAISEHRPIDDLADVGIVSLGDGSYSVDLNAYPQWNDLFDLMANIFTHEDLDKVAHMLGERGFRPQDLAVLREYVTDHGPRAESRAAAAPVALGFGRVVKKHDRSRSPVPDSAVLSFFYQRALAIHESDQAWAAGLLKQLDAQRGRILLSAFLDMRTEAIWMPDDISGGITDMLAQARQPEFDQRVTNEAEGVAK
jgi:hypothetical protein